MRYCEKCNHIIIKGMNCHLDNVYVKASHYGRWRSVYTKYSEVVERGIIIDLTKLTSQQLLEVRAAVTRT